MSDEIELIRLRQRYGQAKEALAEEKAEIERLRSGREIEQTALRNALPIVARVITAEAALVTLRGRIDHIIDQYSASFIALSRDAVLHDLRTALAATYQ